jgi:hypothetical protein
MYDFGQPPGHGAYGHTVTLPDGNGGRIVVRSVSPRALDAGFWRPDLTIYRVSRLRDALQSVFLQAAEGNMERRFEADPTRAWDAPERWLIVRTAKASSGGGASLPSAELLTIGDTLPVAAWDTETAGVRCAKVLSVTYRSLLGRDQGFDYLGQGTYAGGTGDLTVTAVNPLPDDLAGGCAAVYARSPWMFGIAATP